VQVAAFQTRASADALAKRLADRGFESRVYGTAKPYRVRVGRYATREEAEEAVRRLKRRGVTGVVMEAERP
jgi:cell division protein FtsN